MLVTYYKYINNRAKQYMIQPFIFNNFYLISYIDKFDKYIYTEIIFKTIAVL